MELITFGKIIKPQGVKGEVKIQLYSNADLGIENLKKVYIDQIGEKIIKTVSVRFGFGYILFEDVKSKNEAEVLRGKEVSADKKALKISENIYFQNDIFNCDVVDKKNNYIGKVVDIQNYNATDIWTVESDGRKFSIPFITTIVEKIDIPNKKIIINKKAFDEGKICE